MEIVSVLFSFLFLFKNIFDVIISLSGLFTLKGRAAFFPCLQVVHVIFNVEKKVIAFSRLDSLYIEIRLRKAYSYHQDLFVSSSPLVQNYRYKFSLL